jgi:hypothetical protein
MKAELFMKYFVLSPWKSDIYGEASCKAMLTYAEVIEKGNPEFADEIRKMVFSIRSPIITKELLDGLAGQDKKSYTDDQDRENYQVGGAGDECTPV